MTAMTDNAALHFTKGHGTENDFVLVPDLDASRDLTAEQVRLLADRRAGIGGDGVIRVVPTQAAVEPHVRAQAANARWFMDYRNADGSAAEMCGNGTRVFAAYLRREGLETARRVRDRHPGRRSSWSAFEDGLIAVDLGDWRLSEPDARAGRRGFDALVKVAGHEPMPGLSLDLGNPHTVVALPDAADLAGARPHRARRRSTRARRTAPTSSSSGRSATGHLAMRVHERGVGETRSCGTGAAAAALATRCVGR